MKHLPILVLLAILAWLGGGSSDLLAQEQPQLPLTPPSQETTANPSEPPSPQLMQVEVDLGTGGPNIHVRIHPAWQARYRPYIRVGQARAVAQPETETAPPPPGGAEELHQALENALDRAKPPAAPAP